MPPPIDKENNLENQIQEVLDKNLTIKNLNRGATYEIPPNHKIKIDYLAWFIQLLIWNIVVVVVNNNSLTPLNVYNCNYFLSQKVYCTL